LSVISSQIFYYNMPQTREQKKKIIEQLKEDLNKQKITIFVEMDKLKANSVFDLRRKLKEKDCLLRVVKKTLLKLSFKEKKVDFDIKRLKGQVALVFGFKDEISPAKIAHSFSKENSNFKILGGFFEGKFREMEEIVALAQIPSKEELLSKVVSSIFSPVSNFVNVLQGNIRGLINILSKVKK